MAGNMKISNTITSMFKNTSLAIHRIIPAFRGLCILLIAVSFSASLLDYLLSIANISSAFIFWAGRGLLTLTWLIVAIKWWKHHKKKITRISQFTPEQHKEYEEDKLKRNEASKTRSNKIALLFVIGFALYFIWKSNIGYALFEVLLDILGKIFSHKTFLWIIAFYVFYSIIEALNHISDNIYHGITEIKEKLDIIINQTE
jgi:hypothetical protein